MKTGGASKKQHDVIFKLQSTVLGFLITGSKIRVWI
jgi:hypothetical protein